MSPKTTLVNDKKKSSKEAGLQRQRRRRLVTFVRMCRYGINNFTRNAWLSLAATAVMTITLFVIFSSFAARTILVDTAVAVRDSVNMSIYVLPDTTEKTANQIEASLRDLDSVLDVVYVSSSDARAQIAEENSSNPDYLEALKESTNKTPGTFNIKVKDINDTAELSTFVKDNKTVRDAIDPAHKPSFDGHKQTIETIAGATAFAQQVGIVTSIIFVIMSLLIIFNTISMAIFNRRDEITMMKLIGAEKSFIRGPFIVEAVVYGFFAAIIATGLGFAALYTVAPALQAYDIAAQATVDFITFYAGFVLLGLMLIGAVIGIIASLLATRRHLHL